MLSRFRKHLSPGTVIGTIALFVALGGGYAMAFVGSGQLQKAHKTDISEGAAFDTVRTLDGIGSVQANCDDTDPDDQLIVRVRNTSGETMEINSVEATNGDYDTETLNNNQDEDQIVAPVQVETIRYHIYDQNEKAPQADILVTAQGPTGEQGVGCDLAELSVLVLNTQES